MPSAPPRPVSALLSGLPAALLCGCDEAGRGSLTGPVVAAAVILKPYSRIAGLDDSKVLSRAKREALSQTIQRHALAWAIGQASSAEIEELNIHHASLLAMRRAIDGLGVVPTAAVVDGLHVPQLPHGVAGRAIVDGDALLPCIMAAGIVAKVARDAMLAELDNVWPGYNFGQHAGYSTPQHLAVLRRLGPCPEHRRRFKHVAEHFGLFAGLDGKAEPASAFRLD